MRSVSAPARALAMAATVPAEPEPTTTTSAASNMGNLLASMTIFHLSLRVFCSYCLCFCDQLLELLWRYANMEDFGDVVDPGDDKIAPSVVDVEPSLFLLSKGLLEKVPLPTVVEFPDNAMHREQPRICNRRSRTIFAHPGRIDDQRTRRQCRHEPVILIWVLIQHIDHLNSRWQLLHHCAQLV